MTGQRGQRAHKRAPPRGARQGELNVVRPKRDTSGAPRARSRVARGEVADDGVLPRFAWDFGALAIERTRFEIVFSRVRAPRSARSWGLGPPPSTCAHDGVLAFEPSTVRPLARDLRVSWLAGHFLWVLVWAGACYWHGVGGFMFNSSS